MQKVATIKNPMKYACAGILCAVALACCAGCAGPRGDPGFFRGKTVTLIVPYGKGGGFDEYARAIAPFLQKYLPGSRVEVMNVTGNGGNDGRNMIFAAPPDGLTLGFTPGSGALLAEWGGDPRVKYRTAEFSWIGRVIAEAHIMAASPGSGFRTLGDVVRAGRLSMGFTGVGSDDFTVALITAKLLGYTVEARTTFLSSDDANLACVRGEIDAVQFSKSSVLSQIQAGTLMPLVTFSAARAPDLPDVPTIFESVPAGRLQLMRAAAQMYALDRTMLGPPGMPAGRLQALRDALDRSMADAEFKRNIARLKRPVDYLGGKETERLLEGILSVEDAVKQLVIEVAKSSR
jgi:tripartite-type tricarboxylate transporter receptor subunit TctC